MIDLTAFDFSEITLALDLGKCYRNSNRESYDATKLTVTINSISGTIATGNYAKSNQTQV